MATKVKAASAKEVELNRWCIEIAVKWPVIHTPASSYGVASGGTLGGGYVDADVLGRARKIRDWVKASS